MSENKNESFSESANDNIEIILGDHKTAIRRFAVPMIFSMLIMSIYNLIDGIWVAGLGGPALAALGFVTPMYMIISGISNGMGAGVTSLISRYIGAKDKEGSNLSASQAILISFIASILLSIIFLIFQKDILILLGAKEVLSLSLQYSTIIFAGIILFVLSSVASGILRAEGDVKRVTYVMAVSAVLNIILDPIFIYTFEWGIAGAAWATLLSVLFSTIIILYWILVKKDTFVTLKKEYFKFNTKIIRKLLAVGIPASFEMVFVALSAGLFNGLLILTGGVDAVAVYSAGMRFVMFAIVPAIGLALATVTVAGAAYGAHKFKKLNETFKYSIRIGFLISIVLAILVFIFAPYIALLFSYSNQTAHLTPYIADFLRVMSIFFLAEPFGVIPSSVFQSMGKGVTSLILTIIRETVAMIIFASIFVFVFNMGYVGVWWGVAIGKLVGSLIGYFYTKLYIKHLIKLAEEKYSI